MVTFPGQFSLIKKLFTLFSMRSPSLVVGSSKWGKYVKIISGVSQKHDVIIITILYFKRDIPT